MFPTFYSCMNFPHPPVGSPDYYRLVRERMELRNRRKRSLIRSFRIPQVYLLSFNHQRSVFGLVRLCIWVTIWQDLEWRVRCEPGTEEIDKWGHVQCSSWIWSWGKGEDWLNSRNSCSSREHVFFFFPSLFPGRWGSMILEVAIKNRQTPTTSTNPKVHEMWEDKQVPLHGVKGYGVLGESGFT